MTSQEVKGSITNDLAIAFFGLLGGQAEIFNLKGERGSWKGTLPETADEINILNLTNQPENQGVLDPYVSMKKKDSDPIFLF